MKYAVLHDYFESAEGGGRLALTAAQAVKADLYYGFKLDKHPYFNSSLFTGRHYPLARFTGLPIWRQLSLVNAFSRKTGFLSEYNAVLYSGTYTPFAVYNHTGGRNIYYCHTPPRFAYDQKDFFSSLIPAWQRPLLHAFNKYLRPRYEAALRKMDIILTNSSNVKKRIREYLGLDAMIVYPPCDINSFCWIDQHEFYLSTARLDPLKRIDLIIEAFCRMPEKKLIVVSDGSELRRLKTLAEKVNNIQIMGLVSEKKLTELLGCCIATIYIPKDEDFGMSPVESMAAGKPVISVEEGGILETLQDGKTAFLVNKNFLSSEDLINAVRRMTPETAKSMRRACEKRAAQFRTDIFVKKIVNLMLS